MSCIISGLKNFKARRASVKELRGREKELKEIYKEMRAVDDRYNNTQTFQTYYTEENTHADRTGGGRASKPHMKELRPPSTYSIHALAR